MIANIANRASIYMWYMFVWINLPWWNVKKIKIAVLGHFAECCTRQMTPLPSAMVTALDKAGKWSSGRLFFLALPSAVTMTLGNGVICRVQHSAKWPKTAIFNFFFYIPSWQINSYKHISHIYLIHHIYISSIHTSICTYHIYNNKCSSPSK